MPKSDHNSGKPWTVKEVAQIKEFTKHNTPTCVIGRKIGRTPAAIYIKAGEKEISLEHHKRSPYGTKNKSLFVSEFPLERAE